MGLLHHRISAQVAFLRCKRYPIDLTIQPSQFYRDLYSGRRQELVILVEIDVKLGRDTVLEDLQLQSETAVSEQATTMRTPLVGSRCGAMLCRGIWRFAGPTGGQHQHRH
jgi:hypothetical protein